MSFEEPQAIRTTCPYCGVGCGVRARRESDGSVQLSGDPEHPSNFGRLCSKGSALPETVGLAGRLLYPKVDGRRMAWDDALGAVADGFTRAIEEHGPDSVAFYCSGQLLTEDYYLANKLMKGFIGSANIDTNSRLCMASAVAGHKRAFGADTVPCTYEDLEEADLVVLVGSNLAWCHPVIYQRIAAAKEKRPEMKIVLIDPRRTMTADIADLHLPIRADGDVALFTGLLAWLDEHDAIDRSYVENHTEGFGDALKAAQPASLERIAMLTGLNAEQLTAFYDLFTRIQKTVTLFSQGVNQSQRGTDKVNAIINYHLATGRIGRPGMGPFSITGQPNAMGGREVGGLANTLAAHMELEDSGHRDRVQRFWHSPRIADKPGLKAVELFQAVADGRIKALWIMATNPADTLPEADLVEQAIKDCPFVVVSDVVNETDTVRHAHVKLPAAAWGEKDGTVTNSERRISRQRPFLPMPGDAQPDWWIIAEVGKRMGFEDAFAYDGPDEIFAEHAALSAFENEGTRDFDIGACAGLDRGGYDALQPFQWPRPKESTSSGQVFVDGGFFTQSGRGRLVPISPSVRREHDPAFPMTLNTGRVRDHWHSMTRTGRSPRLSQHLAEPFVELNPRDAARHGIANADIVRVSSGDGAILVRALLTDRQSPGSVFVPMHWTDQFASNARVDRLVPAVTDPLSGQPASKNAAVRIERFVATTYGFAVLAHKPRNLNAEYWAIARCDEGWRVELGFAYPSGDWRQLARELFDAPAEAELLAYEDHHGGQQRFASFKGSQLTGALYLAAEPVPVSRSWATDQLLRTHEERHARLAVIAGRPGGDVPDRGAIVCTCFGVGANEIARAAAGGCATVEAVGEALQAGTNCGSCRAEIKGIIDANRLQAAE
ncbi:Nitrate reductase [Methyloligella halotolerans]|uniref:Nitrate reductase n=1 Tax=Methyloligella halotolerans TaxID=1177755 RepID=A0A1E2RVU0_9HYPH|nr:nitrate reductase [Methyloligella halotolerans]ODA66169.1 Nitrate reductase [Methyloligella halotolerans]